MSAYGIVIEMYFRDHPPPLKLVREWRVSTEIISVTAVHPLEGLRIRATFSDGAVKEIDLGDQLAQARGVFLALRDPHVFSAVRVNEETHAVEWPGEIDLDAEVLYGLFEPAVGPPLRRRTVREPARAAG